MNTVPEPATPLVDATPAPSWHRPFARIVTTQFVFGLGFSVLSMAPSMLVRSFHADAREVGVATAMVAFGAVSLAPFAGLALDRYGRVALVRLGCLAESIRMHPAQGELKALMHAAGFGHVDYHNLTGGMVALHVGIKC